ncbi:MAG TPA: sulfite exporter TauE/SafE family protein [Bacillota bacterium]
MFFLSLVGLGLSAGLLGSMLGIGGGVFLVPLFTLLLKLPIHLVIGTSLVAVVATSCAGTQVYFRKGLPDVRLAMLLELPTVAGAIAGGLLGALLNPGFLTLLFGVIALYTAWSMANWRPVAAALDDAGAMAYRPQRLPLGMAMSAVGGLASGLLGIGGGVIKVPIMTLAMRIPPKVAAATSNFMVGITAVASAFVYFAKGFIDPQLAAPTALAVLAGASLGARLGTSIHSRSLCRIFAVVLALLAVQMLGRGLSVLFGTS